MAITAELSIFLTINDVPALVRAARKRYMDECPTETSESAAEFIADDDISGALRMLLDPGISPDGCEIEDSTCEVSH